jgi:hypothetical protein
MMALTARSPELAAPGFGGDDLADGVISLRDSKPPENCNIQNAGIGEQLVFPFVLDSDLGLSPRMRASRKGNNRGRQCWWIRSI